MIHTLRPRKSSINLLLVSNKAKNIQQASPLSKNRGRSLKERVKVKGESDRLDFSGSHLALSTSLPFPGDP